MLIEAIFGLHLLNGDTSVKVELKNINSSLIDKLPPIRGSHCYCCGYGEIWYNEIVIISTTNTDYNDQLAF
jgi:hypothetical protein